MKNETTIFEYLYENYKITKPVRLIEFFAGYGSQALALKYLGVDFEHWKICEWATKSIQAYKDIHFTNEDYKEPGMVLEKDDLVEILYHLGISSNYNEPMSKEQIKRLKYDKLWEIYKNIKITHNLVNIQQVKGKDLDIRDTDKYTYLLTYSFPCQDLSLAGKGKGMSDTSTRSGMLWEVERILNECKELGTMPEVLLMENVSQVHGTDNVKDFNKWQLRLEELGYKNYFDDLIATDYGIPQTRNRCFMISILGDYNYSFPPKQELKLRLKDMLEDEVDEKYYLSDKMIDFYIFNTEKQKEKGNGFKFEPVTKDEAKICKTITTRSGSRMDDNFITNKPLRETLEKYTDKIVKNNQFIDTYNKVIRDDDLSCTITTRVNASNNNFLLVKKETKKGYLETHEDDGVVVNMKTKLCNDLIKEKKVEKYDVIRHSYTTSRMNGEMKDLKQNNLSPTLDTRCDCLGVVVGTYQFSKSDNFMKGKSRFQVGKDVSDTILTSPKEAVVIKPKVLGGIGEKKSNGGTQWYQKDRIYDNKIAISVTTAFNPYYKDDLRIRKLTPRECFRLMGVKDEDYDKVAKNQSDASLYHLAGDSIVVNVLMAILKNLF